MIIDQNFTDGNKSAHVLGRPSHFICTVKAGPGAELYVLFDRDTNIPSVASFENPVAAKRFLSENRNFIAQKISSATI